jgi:hypothetical protein
MKFIGILRIFMINSILNLKKIIKNLFTIEISGILRMNENNNDYVRYFVASVNLTCKDIDNDDFFVTISFV